MNRARKPPFFLSLLHRIVSRPGNSISDEETKKQHISMLKQGADAWMLWREYHPDLDLSGVSIVSEHLGSVNLAGVRLEKARFKNSYLEGASFYLMVRSFSGWLWKFSTELVIQLWRQVQER